MKKQNIRKVRFGMKVSGPKSSRVYERIQMTADEKREILVGASWSQYLSDGNLNAHLRRVARIMHGRVSDDSA